MMEPPRSDVVRVEGFDVDYIIRVCQCGFDCSIIADRYRPGARVPALKAGGWKKIKKADPSRHLGV